MRSILCPADSSKSFPCRLETAMALARVMRGHVTLQIATPIAQIATWEPFGGAVISATAISQARQDDEKLANTLQSQLSSQDVPFDIEMADNTRALALSGASRLADIVVMSMADPTLEDVALAVRCPVLAVPGEKPLNTFDGNVLVAWDGGPEAANALRASLPLLKSAGQIHVVTVREKQTDFPATEALSYLSRHGIHAELHDITPTGSVSDAIMATARDIGASLIVMGVFGRSRLRELLLGGVSRDLLDRSEVPLLLSH